MDMVFMRVGILHGFTLGSSHRPDTCTFTGGVRVYQYVNINELSSTSLTFLDDQSADLFAVWSAGLCVGAFTFGILVDVIGALSLYWLGNLY